MDTANMKVTYLAHSGFLLEWAHCYWLFDYYRGAIPKLDPGKKLFVFVSHSHGDHFNPAVLRMFSGHGQVEYVFSNEVKRACLREQKKQPGEPFPRISFLNAWADAAFEDGAGNAIQVHAMHSTDCGAAFFIRYLGRQVYHAGDLHWWTWPGEPEEENRQMAGNFKKEMEYLEGKQIDLAFTPLDPRQEEDFDLGMDYLLAHAKARYVFPMHFWDDFSVISRYLGRKKPCPDADAAIMKIERDGQSWEVDL